MYVLESLEYVWVNVHVCMDMYVCVHVCVRMYGWVEAWTDGWKD